MAGPKTPSGDATEHIAERVVDIDVEREMQAAFLEYAYSVIYSRALPDARDGLKPVQRRILYTMAEMGLRPDRAHVKSGRIVGDVMGKLHPHGDGAIYDALVRLAQDFTMRLPLVDGHGNFGSLDDGPAAYRYCVTGDTRVRLADGTSPRIADLADLAPDSERPLDVEVIDRAGQPVRASKIFHSGSHPIVSVQTETGHQLRGSRNHPVLALALVDRVPRLVWRRLDQLHPGDVLCLARNAPLRAPRVSVPDRHLGVLAGAWASQGWASRERAAFTTTDPVYFDLVVTAYRDLVGGRTFVDRRPVHRSGATTYMLDVHDTTALARSAIGELVGLRAKDVRIPDAVWRAGAGAKRSFLQAAFEGDGSIVRTRLRTVSLEYRTYSRSLAHDVQELLLEFGVVAHLTQDVARDEYRLIVAGRANVDLFVAEVGFLSGKRERLAQALAELPEDAHRLGGDLAPFLGEYLLRSMPHQRLDGEEHPGDDGWAGPPDDDPSAEPPDDLADPLPAGPWGGSGEATGPRRRATDTLPLVTARSGPVRSVVAAIMEPGFRYVAVASVEHLGPEPVYSVKVDSDDHSYLAGGFVNHNTEARMAPAAMLMTDGLDEDVVDFVPNYDGQLTQPDVMPSTLPNLLVNGASGIAVGMATNMPPHNLVEVVGAARHLIAHPDATLEDLMRFVPGPDLPTGGRIVGLDGIRDAYAGGRGTFRTRATTRIESVTARRQGIVVTELPYLVGPEKVIEKIKTLVQAGKLKGIADVADLTDREKGLRLVIELKGGFNAEAVLEQLFRMTPLEDSFGINNVALVEGQPRTLGLRELLEVFIGHRLEVVRRRCTYRLGKAGDRLHLVEGLLIAILDIDEVIAVIRGSDDTAQARERLMTVFDLTRVQADYILEMPLRRLTKYSTIELETERTELQATMAELEAILASEARRREVVSAELAEVATTYGTPRRTVLLESAGVAVTASRATPLEVTDDPCRVLLSSTGLLARTAGDEPLTPPDSARRASHDVVVSAVRATARGEVAAVTNHGRMIRLSVVDMPALPPTSSAPSLAGGARIEEFLALGKGERVLCLSTLAEDSPGLALGTAQGVVKRVATDYPANKESWEMIALRDGDEVVGAVELPSERCDLVFISSDAQLLRFDAERVRPQGRAAGGMAGIALSAGARAVFFGAVDLTLDDGEWASAVVTVAGDSGGLPGTQAGTAKVTPFAEYPAKGRATGGVRCQRFLKGEDTLLLAWAGTAPPIAAAGSGVAVPLPPVDSRRDGSGTPLRQPISAVAGPPR